MKMSACRVLEDDECGTWVIVLLVQVARSLRAVFDRAGGLDGAVECGGDGVCEKMEQVRLSGIL